VALLRHGRIFTDRRPGSAAHLRWLTAQKLEHSAQQIVALNLVDAVHAASERLARFVHHIADLVPDWSMAPTVFVIRRSAASPDCRATFAVEVGDVRRFGNPRQLMAFLGLVPSERSTGESVKRGSLTLAGNRRARRMLVEGCLELSLSCPRHRDDPETARRLARGHARDLVEGAGPALQALVT